MMLGLGSSGPQVAEGWHGQRFARQIQRTREYVAVVRKVLARERLEFRGETLELPLPDGPGKALKLTIAPVQERIPIYLAAIGPNNIRLAGEVADGWIPMLLSPEHLGEVRPLLEEGAGRAGRSLDGFDIAPSVCVAVDDDAGRGARRDAPADRPVRRGDGLAGAQLLQRRGQPLRVRAGRGPRPGPVPRRPPAGRRGRRARRARRPRHPVRAGRPRARAPGRLPRGRRGDAGGHPDGARRATRGSSSCAASPSLPGSGPPASPRLRLLLGAFGDPGHAFPTIALGRALVGARAHGGAADLGALARAGAGRGDALRAGARVPRDPWRGLGARALRGSGAGRAGHAAAGRRAAAGRGRGRHPHAGAGARRRGRGAAGGHADPPHRPARRARLPAVRARRAAASHGGRAALVGCRRPRRRARAGARARRAQPRRAGSSGCRRWPTCTAGSRAR